MNRSTNDLPVEIIIEIIGNLSSNIADYLPLRLVSSRWKYSIDCYFATIKHLVHRNIKREGTAWVTKDGLIAHIPFGRTDSVINCLELFPNLKAVSVKLSKYTKKDQDTLFTYLNTRSTITTLELFCYADTKLQNDVKLENIQNFALKSNRNPELSKNAISRLFQADHKLTQLSMYNRDIGKSTLEDEISILKRMPTIRMFSQQMRRIYNLFWTKQCGLSFENLESYSFQFGGTPVDFFNYIDNFVACCPNLKNIDCSLIYSNPPRIRKPNINNNFRAHTNVENLAIRCYVMPWELVLKILEIFPMVKNLKLEYLGRIDHEYISQALSKLPNLSLFVIRHPSCKSKFHFEVNCMALKEEYNSKYGRDLKIVMQSKTCLPDDAPFRHEFNFMKNIFWIDRHLRLLTD